MSGVIGKFVDGIEKWFESVLKDGITSIFESIGELLQNSFSNDTGKVGSFSNFINMYLKQHPAHFTGAPDGSGTTIWSTIEGICNNAVVPLAGMILVILLLNDLIQMCIQGNNMKDFDDSIFIKWIIKALCGVILISNIYYIASGLFSFGVGATNGAINTLFGSGATAISDVTLNKAALNGYGIGTLISVLFLSLFVYLGIFLMIAVIIVVLASRMIEIFMYLSVAPVPVATLIDGGEFGSIGKNWIKQLVALSFQGFFIVIAIGIFKTIFNNAIASINNTSSNIILQMAILLGYTFSLMFTVLRTSAISKSAFNTH